ncbi:MAG: cbb3-type cytochrome c oxidase subunit I [Verrucomicrobia subdivision 3 bacterium]|nr:cbb3-type cytochrome c oxidase subunit I [Limisphaerales bacterium]
MNVTPTPSPPEAVSAAPVLERIPASEIDASCRPPLMFYFGSGLVWLFVGTVFWLIASMTFYVPALFADTSWLTVGRVRPAATSAIVYGFAVQTAFGALLWIMCRLGNVRLLFLPALCVAGFIWNLALTAGVLGILAGGSTGFEWFELPKYASAGMFVAYALIAVCAVTNFHLRRDRALFPSQWYLLAALFWFAWTFSAAGLLLHFAPVRGVFQNIVNAWYASTLLDMWLTSVGLAIIFYFLPKLTARPLYSSTLAAFGFWTFAAVAQFAGMARLSAGPVPAWIGSVGVAASGIMVVPLISVAANWYLTLGDRAQALKQSETGPFVWLAAISYVVGGALQIIFGFREVSEITDFTYAELARTQLALHGFVAMALFGGLYYIVPRISQLEWPAPRHVRLHFTLYAAGVAIILLSLLGAGVMQGFRVNKGTVDFVTATKPIAHIAGLSTFGVLLLLAGQVLALKNFFTLCHRASEQTRAYAIDFITGRETVGRSA